MKNLTKVQHFLEKMTSDPPTSGRGRLRLRVNGIHLPSGKNQSSLAPGSAVCLRCGHRPEHGIDVEIGTEYVFDCGLEDEVTFELDLVGPKNAPRSVLLRCCLAGGEVREARAIREEAKSVVVLLMDGKTHHLHLHGIGEDLRKPSQETARSRSYVSVKCSWEGEEDMVLPPEYVLKACKTNADAVGTGKVANTLMKMLL